MSYLLDSQPIFTHKDNGFYVMELYHKFFTIDEELKTVMNVLSTSENYIQATTQYNTISKENFKEEEFKFYAEEILKKFEFEKKQKSFLLVEKIIISPKWAGKISSVLNLFFQPTFFWISFLVLAIFSFYIFQIPENHHHDDGLGLRILPFLLLYFATIPFHEMGHLAACRRFTGKTGGLGLGIYIIYPVFFSDISSIWHAKKSEKIITNLAGIYMQLWFVPILFFYGYFADSHMFVDFCKALIGICFIQVLPFVRSDGYWLLSDLFSVPNLLVKSQEKVKQFIYNPIAFFKNNAPKEILIFAYGVMNYAFVIMFAYSQIRYNFHRLLDLPLYLFDLVKSIFSGNFSSLSFDMQYIPSILFYYISFIYLKQFVNFIQINLLNKEKN